MFLGYDQERKSWRCIDPTTRRTYVSRDVVFDESSSCPADAHPLPYSGLDTDPDSSHPPDSDEPQSQSQPQIHQQEAIPSQEQVDLPLSSDSGPLVSSPSSSCSPSSQKSPWKSGMHSAGSKQKWKQKTKDKIDGPEREWKGRAMQAGTLELDMLLLRRHCNTQTNRHTIPSESKGYSARSKGRGHPLSGRSAHTTQSDGQADGVCPPRSILPIGREGRRSRIQGVRERRLRCCLTSAHAQI